MSEIAAAARVNLVLADYASLDGTGKVNALGVGWQATGVDPSTGSTAPQAVVLFIDIPAAHVGEIFAVELGLYDDSDELVQVPGPIGDLQPLRIGQPVQLARSMVPGVSKPPWCHFQLVVHFANGLPLTPGREYTWQASIDGDDSRLWQSSFQVAAAPVGPTIG